MNETLLDNPAWSALNSEHADFAMGSARAKRYRPGVVPFTACRNAQEGIEELIPWMTKGETFFIIGHLPVLPPHWSLEHELPCAQMVLAQTPPAVARQHDAATVEELRAEDAHDMFQLINLVQPGYYHADTRLLGTYYGIRQNGMLVAMAGERMRMTGFAELSAIATHPEHTGRGYAQRLIEQLCGMHAAKGITSFLHVATTNERAIRLYEHMGFRQRREISFHKVRG
ncbi:GNAT family N-acetyltransferase [Chitinophaga lutea]|uniref:GNAT family N-acetyltransferase n=1 Tax=Chitinophaga lutea TaxID=2488634 RepID=A0A3N4PXI5_9BACT|nr:GNAT family N-acetyltransferase [Chitinophaga lutea]RPE08797.1 GNAT family N-acetyltransferase [Chitinophaga lutea]